jgi:hypothetical protein
MSYVIVTRNPSNGKLIPITEGEGDDVAEFETEGQALAAAANTTVCMAWGYQIVDVGAEDPTP